jgi:hypothetical protein
MMGFVLRCFKKSNIVAISTWSKIFGWDWRCFAWAMSFIFWVRRAHWPCVGGRCWYVFFFQFLLSVFSFPVWDYLNFGCTDFAWVLSFGTVSCWLREGECCDVWLRHWVVFEGWKCCQWDGFGTNLGWKGWRHADFMTYHRRRIDW